MKSDASTLAMLKPDRVMVEPSGRPMTMLPKPRSWTVRSLKSSATPMP
jgi:hypothetical protein